MKRSLLLFAAGAVVLALIPGGASPYQLQIATQLLIFAILLTGLDVAVGHAGMVSIAHGGLFGIGAYTTAVLTVDHGWNSWLALLVAMGLSALIGLLIGVLTLRLDGHYFVVATLGAGVLLEIAARNWTAVTHGDLGISPVVATSFLGLDFTDPIVFYGLVAVFCLAVVALCTNLMSRRTGQKLRAIRDNAPLASAVGINVARSRLVAFTVSAAIAAIAGSLYAANLTYISPAAASFDIAVTAVLAVIVGGRATVLGPFAGAAIFVVLPELLRGADEYRLVIMGVLLIVTIIFAPDGLVGRAKALWFWGHDRFMRRKPTPQRIVSREGVEA